MGKNKKKEEEVDAEGETEAEGTAATDDKNKPKRPMSSYFLFMNERRGPFREKNPDHTMCQITKALTEVWKKLTDDEKKKYDDQHAVAKKKYDEEMIEQGGKPSKSTKAKEKADSGAPKRGLCAYFIFLADNRA